ncbi:hypothetical protein LEQ04_08530 [Riemerella anatipestifer]|nr:hypothetical protein LEQ05_12930 [Riemerella anatipestifer]WPC14625.1 hypothetical protein LEQ04_08530 [Riemerella anatipestifer]
MQHRLNPNKFLYLRSFFREVEAQYETICNHNTCNDYSTQLVAIDLSNYTRLIENIASKLQSGELKPSDLDASLVEQIYKDVSEPVKEVFKNKWINYDYKEPGSLIQKFKKNLWQFSAAKTLAELEYINGLLLDKNGRIRPEHQFMQEVKKPIYCLIETTCRQNTKPLSVELKWHTFGLSSKNKNTFILI